MSEVRTPWIKNIGGIPSTLNYSNKSMFDEIVETSKKYPDNIAYEFMGTHVKYKMFVSQIARCAKALKILGIKTANKVTVCLPNTPQAIIMLYAINAVGAVANMIHPLSAEKEIEFYLRDSESTACITLDEFYPKFAKVRESIPIDRLIITSISDVLDIPHKTIYNFTDGRDIEKIPEDANVILWNDMLKKADDSNCKYTAKRTGGDPAVVLYSGGNSGATKGILLTNRNFNALATQIKATVPNFSVGDKMLAVLPVFHGFGLGIGIHTMLANGGRCILIPEYTPESYAKLLKKHKPNFLVATPNLYEALLRLPSLDGVNLSFIKTVFCGGDSLSIELRKRIDLFLSDHNADITVREGYGMTECITASCLTPIHMHKEGSIGLPLPDTYYKIVKPRTQEECDYGTEGEICISGPTVMVKYVNQPEETSATLRKHKDGLMWLHTGDLGIMDSDGFIYFRQRIKRMIVIKGYNVYPSQLENILNEQRYIQTSCVIGIPDTHKKIHLKAFVQLKSGIEKSEDVGQSILDYCKENIATYAIPNEIEFVDEFPRTHSGSIAYKELEKRESEQRAVEEENN